MRQNYFVNKEDDHNNHNLFKLDVIHKTLDYFARNHKIDFTSNFAVVNQVIIDDTYK